MNQENERACRGGTRYNFSNENFDVWVAFYEDVHARDIWAIQAVLTVDLDDARRSDRNISLHSVIECRQHAGFSSMVIQEAFPQQTILGLVASGLGVSLIHASVERIQQQGVVTKSLIEAAPQLQSAIVWSASTSHPAILKLLEVTREISFD